MLTSTLTSVPPPPRFLIPISLAALSIRYASSRGFCPPPASEPCACEFRNHSFKPGAGALFQNHRISAESITIATEGRVFVSAPAAASGDNGSTGHQRL